MLEGEQHHEVTVALLGREAEIALVDQLLSDVPAGGGALGLYGGHGLGRSAMLGYASARARGAGFAVLRAAGSLHESEAAYSALDQVLQPIHPYVARLSQRVRDALLGVADPRGGSFAPDEEVAASLARLVQGLSAQRPLVVLVDDVELVDAKSAAVLLDVFVRQGQPGVAIIVAGQQQSPAGAWQTLAAHHLQPLTSPLGRVLVTRSRPELPASCVSAVVSSSAGHPLVLRELALEASIDPTRFAQAVAAGQLPVPARLKERGAVGFASLSEQGRRTVITAALAPPGPGRRLCVGELKATDQKAVRHGGLVVLAPDGTFTFCHELARRVVVELTGSTERRGIHRLLAENRGVDDRARTAHLAAATLAPDSAVSRSVMAAAGETVREGDPGQAIRGFLHAAALAPSAAQQGAPLARAAHLEAVVMGRLGEADALLRGATGRLERQPGLRAATTDVILRFVRAGDVDTSYRLLTDAVACATASDDDQDAVVDALEALLSVCVYSGRRDYCEGLLELIRRLGITDAMVTSKAMLYADPLAHAGTTAPELQRRLAALPSEPNPIRAAQLAALGLTIPLSSQMRPALLRLAHGARDGGPVVPGTVALRTMSVHAFLEGEWDDAIRLADEAVAMSKANDLLVHAVVSRLATALVYAGRGNVAACNATCAAMVNWARPRDVGIVQRSVAHVRTLAALAHGEYRAARHHARPFFEADLVPVDLLHLMDPVEAGVLNGDHDLARAVATRYQLAGVGAASPHAELLVAGAQAACAQPLDAGLYDEALALPAAAEFWFDRARIELRYGQRLRRARETLPARRHLAVALDLFESMAAAPWAEQARAELLATNPRKTKPADTARPSLTAQEWRVGGLAAEGLSNAEIGERLQISARTVGAHLHHIFEKAEVKNRAMLAAALRSSAASWQEARHGDLGGGEYGTEGRA